MERSLDPEFLAFALGQHANLPKPAVLSELIAKAELGLLQHRPEFDMELKTNGWYLHAIGSSKYAQRMYGVDRQRAAFQVSAHIFDLYLQSQELTLFEKLKYSFASQVAYLRSELAPNAIAIHNRMNLEINHDLNITENHQEIALSCAVSLLGMDAGYIYKFTDSLQNEIDRLLAEWDVDNIFDTPFGAAAGVALATRDMISYLVYGRMPNLERAKDLLNTSIQSNASLSDQISRWVAAHLLSLSDDLRNSSIWTVLPPDVPPNVRKAFSMASPKILTLWPPQIQLFTENMAQGINPLSPDAKRLFIATPTSGGKTLLAQLLIVSHLSTARTSVCYIAPTRSLCREVGSSLEKRLRYLGQEIMSGLPEGDWFDNIPEINPQVEVMTPERLSYLLHSDSKKLLEKFGMFIFDEVHTLGESGRGWTLEEDLTYLQYATQGKEHRIAFVSAAIGNKIQFIEWLGTNGNAVVQLSTEWRGPRRLYAIWRTDPDWNTRTEVAVSRTANYTKRRIHPLYGRLDTLIPHAKGFFSIQTSEPIGELALKVDAHGNRIGREDRHSTPYNKMLVPLVLHLALSGPVLIVESTIPRTISLAKSIAKELETVVSPIISQLMDLVEIRLGPGHSLRDILSKGVAYHHGSLPQDVRNLIEDAVNQGQLKILVATTTMTEGVNLPVRSVIIASQGSFTEQGYQEYITGSKLVNAIGRAGRAAKETEGIIVLALNQQISAEDFKKFTPDPSEMNVTSNIATQEALEALAEFEERVRESEDAIFQTHHQIISRFLSFVWYFASESEQRNETLDDEKLRGLLAKSLAWSQLTGNDQSRWFSIAQIIANKYSKTDGTTRKRWATSGTSLDTARVLEVISREVFLKIGTLTEPLSSIDLIKIILNDGREERILNLFECPHEKVYTNRSGRNRQEIILPMSDVLENWVMGRELVEISNSFFGGVIDVDFRLEQLGEFISKYFETFFPWVFGTIISWTNSMFVEKGLQLTLPRSIPANIRWGVNNNTALELMIRGISSRSLANRIGMAWEEAKIDTDVHSWLRSMDIDAWRDIFKASVPELRNLLEFARIRRGGLAADVINRGSKKIEVYALEKEIPLTDASLRFESESDLSPIGVWVNENLVARIASRDQADVSSLVSTGLISAQVEIVSGKGMLELRLQNIE